MLKLVITKQDNDAVLPRKNAIHRNTRNFSTMRSHSESKDRYGLPLTNVRNMTQRNLSKVL